MVRWSLFQSPTAAAGYPGPEKAKDVILIADRVLRDGEKQHHFGPTSTTDSKESARASTSQETVDDWDWVDLGDEPSLDIGKDAVVKDDYLTSKLLEEDPPTDEDEFADRCRINFSESTSDDDFVDLEENDINQVRHGARVIIHGLKKATEFNGEEGIAESWNEADKSWLVKLQSGDRSIRPENLRNAPEESESPITSSIVPNKEIVPDISSNCSETSSDDAFLQCIKCNTQIFRASEIISSSYRAMTGPGYLTNGACNVIISEKSDEAVYTTGRYTVKKVSCECCSAMLGITYVGAAVIWNQHKVGNFLLGQDLLEKVQK